MTTYKVDNEELRKEIKKYIKTCEFKWIEKNGKWKKKIVKRGELTGKLSSMVLTIAQGLATKGNWRNYTWKEDFVSQGVLTVLKYIHNFDPESYSNAHGYVNKICSNAFSQYVKKENKHSDMKQSLYDKKDLIHEKQTTASNIYSSINYENLKDRTDEKVECSNCGKKESIGLNHCLNCGKKLK